MNNTIKYLDNGDFEVMYIDDSRYNKSAHRTKTTKIEIKALQQQAVDQYKAGLVEWLKSKHKLHDKAMRSVLNGKVLSAFHEGHCSMIDILIQHIEADNEKVER